MYSYVIISLTTRIKNLVHKCTFEQGALLFANRKGESCHVGHTVSLPFIFVMDLQFLNHFHLCNFIITVCSMHCVISILSKIEI